MIRLLLIALIALVALMAPASAHTIEAGDLTIIHPTSRPNLPNRPAVAYVTIANDGAAPDRLLRVSSPMFDTAELHRAMTGDNVMKMSPVEAIDLPANDVVELVPGGNHIMLFGARMLFRAGDHFPLIFSFEKAGDVEVEVLVEPLGTGGMDHSQMGHGQMNKTGN